MSERKGEFFDLHHHVKRHTTYTWFVHQPYYFCANRLTHMALSSVDTQNELPTDIANRISASMTKLMHQRVAKADAYVV